MFNCQPYWLLSNLCRMNKRYNLLILSLLVNFIIYLQNSLHQPYQICTRCNRPYCRLPPTKVLQLFIIGFFLFPGHYFSVGQHNVLYQAADADGNKAKCGFTINVVPANGRSSSKTGSHSIISKSLICIISSFFSCSLLSSGVGR